MFTVPSSKKSIKQNRFEFTLDGATFDIPKLQFAPVAAAEAFERERNVEGILLCCNSPEAADALRSLDGDQFAALMSAWQEASEVNTGESRASAGS